MAPADALPADRDVVLCECFARDGLQHESGFMPTDAKRALIEDFARLGFVRVEATSYSNPKVVPQFADASSLLKGLARRDGVFYKATCANVRAVERALADADAGFGANEVSILVSATESHSQRNLARPRADQWANVRAMVAAAAGRFRLVGNISCAFGCPFEGAVDPDGVLDDLHRMFDLGIRYLTLSDTIGTATPVDTRRLFARLQAALPQAVPVAHFHDTRGSGLANYVAALEAGVRHFDCAFGGVGGHPAKVKYGGGHTGNVCTEDLIDLFEAMGVRTGVDRLSMMAVSRRCEELLGRELLSRVARTGLNPLHAPA
ncbi:MAG: hydroxymethylglutaryl-CoA lyase [Rubrivivax sp.]